MSFIDEESGIIVSSGSDEGKSSWKSMAQFDPALMAAMAAAAREEGEDPSEPTVEEG